MSTFTSSGIQSAASFLLDDLQSNGCAAVAKTSVSDFQSAYNAAGGSPALKVDGLYGPLTSGALQSVIDVNEGYAPLAGETAPTGCVSQGGGTGPAVNPPVVVSTASSGSSPLPYIVGAIVIAGALAAYTYSHKKKRR